MKIPASMIDFEYKTGLKENGCFADFDESNSLTHLGYYEDGKLQKGVFIDGPDNSYYTKNDHYFNLEMMPTLMTGAAPTEQDKQEQFLQWVNEQIYNIKPKSKDSELDCGFCGALQTEVKKLIAGQNFFICNNCVELCNEILQIEGINPA